LTWWIDQLPFEGEEVMYVMYNCNYILGFKPRLTWWIDQLPFEEEEVM
jgi:hypothetical protein